MASFASEGSGRIVGPLTKEQWDAVRIKCGTEIASTNWDYYKEDSCLAIDKNQYCSQKWYKEHGVQTIISYKEYMGDEIINNYQIY